MNIAATGGVATAVGVAAAGEVVAPARMAPSEILTADWGRLVRRLWRAPRADRSALVAPDWNEWPDALAANRSSWSVSPIRLGGLPLVAFRAAARCAVENLLPEEARVLVSEASHGRAAAVLDRPVSPRDHEPTIDPAWIVTGHQPELFHPGVWAKNAAAARLSQRPNAIGINLIIDSDLAHPPEIAVPRGDRRSVRLEPIAFDAPGPLVPWEAQTVRDPAHFATFAQRVQERLAAWGIKPLITDVWPAAIAAANAGQPWSVALSATRIAQERRWGWNNHEVRWSQVCATTPFAVFVGEVVASAARFRDHYNAVLDEYRRLNRVRSRSHPVPELIQDGEWIEVPFWGSTVAAPARQRLFARPVRNGTELRAGQTVIGVLPAIQSAPPCTTANNRSSAQAWADIAETWQTWSRRGWRIRSRALMTTMFTRLALADLFIHGLGGAKYDEMTDALIGRFFGGPPPRFATITATAHLPLGGGWGLSREILGRQRHRLRDTLQNPERHPPENRSETVATEWQSLADRIQQLTCATVSTGTVPPGQVSAEASAADTLPANSSVALGRKGDRQLHRTRAELRQQLRAVLASDISRQQAELADAASLEAAQRILTRREFSGWLFPADQLAGLFGDLFPTVAVCPCSTATT